MFQTDTLYITDSVSCRYLVYNTYSAQGENVLPIDSLWRSMAKLNKKPDNCSCSCRKCHFRKAGCISFGNNNFFFYPACCFLQRDYKYCSRSIKSSYLFERSLQTGRKTCSHTTEKCCFCNFPAILSGDNHPSGT